ncbi:MAG TPA: hydroxyisourate hydrolase, partial [Trebonia sp.]
MSGEAGRVTVSTHVLDASAGVPAGGVHVVLEGRATDGSWQVAGRAVTDADGRARFPGDVAAGDYRLTFGTGAYFAARGTPSFYPEVTVTFAV